MKLGGGLESKLVTFHFFGTTLAITKVIVEPRSFTTTHDAKNHHGCILGGTLVARKQHRCINTTTLEAWIELLRIEVQGFGLTHFKGPRRDGHGLSWG
jgi:hypothetical protein